MLKEKIYSKLLYFVWILGFIAICLLAGYLFNLQTSSISLTENLRIVLEGENGSASVQKIYADSEQLDTMRQDFLSHVTYTVSPDRNLRNGDVLTVHAHPDMSLARSYNLLPNQSTIQCFVSGLNEENREITLIPGSS